MEHITPTLQKTNRIQNEIVAMKTYTLVNTIMWTAHLLQSSPAYFLFLLICVNPPPFLSLYSATSLPCFTHFVFKYDDIRQKGHFQ